MLVIPLAFHKAPQVFLKSRPLPTPLALSASRRWMEWVTVSKLYDALVFCNGWGQFALNHDLQCNDILVFKVKDYNLQVKICKAASSTVIPFTCPNNK